MNDAIIRTCRPTHDDKHYNFAVIFLFKNGLYQVSQKSGTLDFRNFDIPKYSIFWFHQIKHCLLKRMIPRSLKLVEQFWFYGHFSKHSHCQLSLHSRDWIMAFLTSIHCCQETHWSVQRKQRGNLWTAIPAVNSSCRFNKISKWLCFKKWL